jgi:hypothetical protein
MRFIEKVLILLLAISVSVLGFNLIATPSLCLLKAASESGYEPIQIYLEKCYANSFHSEYIAQKTKKFMQYETYWQQLQLEVSPQEKRIDYSSRMANE